MIARPSSVSEKMTKPQTSRERKPPQSPLSGGRGKGQPKKRSVLTIASKLPARSGLNRDTSARYHQQHFCYSNQPFLLQRWPQPKIYVPVPTGLRQVSVLCCSWRTLLRSPKSSCSTVFGSDAIQLTYYSLYIPGQGFCVEFRKSGRNYRHCRLIWVMAASLWWE